MVNTLVSAVLLAIVLLVIGQPAVEARSRQLVSLGAGSNNEKLTGPKAAEAYLDGLFQDHVAARSEFTTGQFEKRSKTVVVYMCYERGDIIKSTLTSLLLSEGLADFDLVISQDGGSSYVVDDEGLQFINSLYIRHPVNLCTGLHHYFVKRFAFDIMGYESLIVVEEDNALHPQALLMLKGMIQLSVEDTSIGLVSVTDMDNSLLVDEPRFANAVLRTDVGQGHLWVYAMHASRYQAVWQHLKEYYDIIKGREYRKKDTPPLRDAITKLHVAKGFPPNIPLSQDAFFVHSLEKEGFKQRYQTLVRLFEPMGWEGLHFRQDPNSFYGTYGKGMYEGSVTGEPFEVTKDSAELKDLEKDCRERLDRIYQQYLGRSADETASNTAVLRLLTGKLNSVELVKNIINSAEHRRRMKEFVTSGSALLRKRKGSRVYR